MYKIKQETFINRLGCIIIKKSAFIFLTFVLLCVFSFNCFAAGSFDMSLSAAQREGENLSVTVNVSEGSALYTTEFYVLYNADELEFEADSGTWGEATKELSPYITVVEAEKGKLKASYTATKSLDGGGALLSFEFKAKKDTVTDLKLEVEHAETFDGEHIRSLEVTAKGTQVQVEKQSDVLPVVLACVGVAVVAVAVVVAVKLKKNK